MQIHGNLMTRPPADFLHHLYVSGASASWTGADVRHLTADGSVTSVHLTDLLPATDYQVSQFIKSSFLG